MDVPFEATAEALHDLARWERHRIEFMHDQALRGGIQPPPDIAFAGWCERLARLEAAAELITILIPHEAAVRALDARLAGPPAPRPEPPTFWPDPPGR